MEISHRPTMLMILDGFGLSPRQEGNAIAQANTPGLDRLFATYPGTQLQACGEAVGLPAGQMGNSEVGHLNIGAGRIVYQELSRISRAAKDGSLQENPALCHAMAKGAEPGRTLHLMGLLSDGGVHSHIDHLLALLDMAAARGVAQICVHAFLDGRDVPPRCALVYLEQLQKHLDQLGVGVIATISGRYYAMDRDKRWDRVQLAYRALTAIEGRRAATPQEAMAQAYANGENDEFVLPTILPQAKPIQSGDAVILYNFRPDRAREITRALVDLAFDGFDRGKDAPQDLTYVCMTQYDAAMPNVSVAFPPEPLVNTFGAYISELGLTQLRIAETEKYAHVTFFFNGGVEAKNPGEDRILVPSPQVATYDLQPEMSAYEVTDQVLAAIAKDQYDCIILNFANADMVGHTGKMDAAIRAIEALDACVPRIVQAVLDKGGQVLLTADHGNADVMLDEAGQVVTAHSLNPVPLLHIADPPAKLRPGKLADLMPTMLTLMGIPVPPEMTGQILIDQ